MSLVLIFIILADVCRHFISFSLITFHLNPVSSFNTFVMRGWNGDVRFVYNYVDRADQTDVPDWKINRAPGSDGNITLNSL
jgi:hypothetical protein